MKKLLITAILIVTLFVYLYVRFAYGVVTVVVHEQGENPSTRIELASADEAHSPDLILAGRSIFISRRDGVLTAKCAEAQHPLAYVSRGYNGTISIWVTDCRIDREVKRLRV